MTTATDTRLTVRVARAGLYAFGVLWLVLGVAIALGALRVGIDDTVSRAVVGALLATDGAMFVVAGRVFARHGGWVDAAVAGLVAINAALTITDQVGPADLAALVLLGGLLVLLLIGMRGHEAS
jgi:hypothetical protein